MKATYLLVAATLCFALPAFAGGNPEAGKKIFNQNCVVCHGVAGHGDGPASAGLNPKPANFSDPARLRVMTEEKQIHVVTNGGAAEKLSPVMPPFGDALSPQQIRDVVAYVRSNLQPKQLSEK
jgi:mono/diheme cytochrome c family protein